MEQKVSAVSKRRKWSVLVQVEVTVSKGRIFTRPKYGKSVKRLDYKSVKEVHEYMHLDVVRMYKRDGILHIWNEKKEHHMHDLSMISGLLIREHKRSGVQTY